jgi:AmmeMemoRadiSam system protein B
MRFASLVLLFAPALAFAQASLRPAGPRPTLEETRRAMGIPSTGELRGQLDIVGYASKPEQMAQAWARAAEPPPPESFGARVQPGLVGAIAPHDDWVYAARVDRQLLPLLTAKTVVVVGVFHEHRRYGAHDQLVFDPYRAWRSPDGELAISSLRDELLAQLPPGDAVKDGPSHDSEHSVEALVFWLKHVRPDLEIVPVLVPAMSFARSTELAAHLGSALARTMKRRGLQLGRDLAILISSDGTHYGSDFQYTPFGAGGVEPFQKAVEADRALLRGPLAGTISAEKARAFAATTVDPERSDGYRRSWCGRFSVPFGLLLLGETARGLGLAAPVGVPLALGSSVDGPQVPIPGLGPTAPSNLYHFVTHPAVAFVGR